MRILALPFAMLSLGAAPPARVPDIADLLAMPIESGLTGAAAAPRFAWVSERAGDRSIWVADAGGRGRLIVPGSGDDGVELSGLALSRDGRRLAWVRGGDAEFPEAPSPNPALAAQPPRQTVLLRDVDGAGPPRAIGEGHDPVFSPDGTRIAFVEGGALWIAPSEGGEPAKVATMAGTIEWLSWSPDGGSLLFSNRRGDHALIGLFDTRAARLSYPDPDLRFDVEPVFSPDGARIAFIRFTNPPADATATSGPYWEIRTIDRATGRAATAWKAPPGGGARFGGTPGRDLFWSADGRLLFPWERDGWMRVYAVAPGGEAQPLTPPAAEVESFLLDSAGRMLLWAGNAGDSDRRHIWRRALSGGATEAVTRGDGIECFPTVAGPALAALSSGVRHPAEIVAIGRDGTIAPFVDHRVDDAPAAGFVVPEPVLLHADDGVAVHAQLFRAAGPGRHPALVFLHGGPRRQMVLGFHAWSYYAHAYALNQYFAAEGYDVLSVNYRGGTGYGAAFRDAPDTGRDGASEYRDVLAGAHWLAAQDHVDPARIGLWGGSWGGYLTALGLARDSALFAAGVDMHGVHNLLRAAPPTLSPDAQDRARRTMWASSPFGALDRWRSPVLLVHGDDDRNVDFAQSVQLEAELAARGVPHRDLMLPNERHGFFRNESWLRAYLAADAFFATELGAK